MEKEKQEIYFRWYDWVFSALTLGIYIILKTQKINYDLNSLRQRIKDIVENYENEIKNKKYLFEQKLEYLEVQKKEKEIRIYELKGNLEKRDQQITKLLKDKEEQLERVLKDKDLHLKEKNLEISKLNYENGTLKNINKNLDIERERITGELKESNAKNLLNQEKISELEKELEVEKIKNINSQLINSNPHDCSKNLTDYVLSKYEESYGNLQKYAKIEQEKFSQPGNKNSKKADFVITYYKTSFEGNIEIQENFKVVIECKNFDSDSPEERYIDTRHLSQLIEYSRLFNARYAILLTNLKLDKNEPSYPFKFLNDWSVFKIKTFFKKPNDADIIIVRPEYFELFLKIFRFLNDSTDYSFEKRKRISKSINLNNLWEFVEFLKSEITGIIDLKKHIQYIDERSKKINNLAGDVNKRIHKYLIPSIEEISSNLHEKTNNMELSLPSQTKEIKLPADSIKEIDKISNFQKEAKQS